VYTVAIVFRSVGDKFGQITGPIFLENLACSGAEHGILDCPRSELGTHMCDHSRDAGVQCFGKSISFYFTIYFNVVFCCCCFLDIDQCTSNNGGCQQICTNLLPGFVCSCYNGFILNDDGITCSGM